MLEVLPGEFIKHKFGLDVEHRTKEYLPTLTPEGERTSWLALADTQEENLEIWEKKLLGFHWYYPITKLRPGATPLVVNPRADKIGDQAMPIMAAQTTAGRSCGWAVTRPALALELPGQIFRPAVGPNHLPVRLAQLDRR